MALLLLIILALAVRILPIWGNNFPFAYDNAKDSLVMMEMFQQHKLPLTGPITSIDGLFNGPAWYYIAFPLNVIGKFHPYASVATVVVLGVITLVLFYKYVGKFAALVYALSSGTIASQYTAWTPYITSFILFPILLLFRNIQSKKTVQTRILAGIFFLTSLLFNLEVAFGVVFLPVIVLAIYLKHARIKFSQWCVAVAAFFVGLIPSALFDLRHQFIQTRAVLHFVTNLGSNSAGISPNQHGLGRIWEVLGYVVSNLHTSILPRENIVLILGAVAIMYVYLKQKKSQEDRRFIYPVVIGVCVLYLLLPVKPFYFVAFTPIWIYLFAKSVYAVILRYIIPLSIIFLLLGAYNTYTTAQRFQVASQQGTFLFSSRQHAVEQAYAFSEGKPFASYQYVPEIYDYVYQLLYLKKGLDGQTMPTEFSYAPGETAYIPQKHIPISDTKPEFIMLIVEKPIHDQYLTEWWGRVASDKEVIDQKQVTDEITVYKTRQR